MQIRDILAPARTQTSLALASKKRVLEHAAKLVEQALAAPSGEPTVTAAVLFDALLNRERLGSTALGEGVAVPHCRIPGGTATLGVLLRLAEGIDFDAPDGKPVDLLFVLVVPAEATDEHLKLLAHLARLFNEPAFRSTLREARSNVDLYMAALEFEKSHARD
jgi:PTS system nitrogen regulatory IIA component